MDTGALERRACRRSIALFPLMNVFYWSALYLYTPTLSTYAAANGASARMVGLIVGGYGLTQAIFRLPFGIWSDRVRRRKPFVCAGMLCAALSALIAAAFPGNWGLFFARCMAGVGASAWVNCTVLYPSYFPPERMDRAESLLNAFSSSGSVISGLLGGWLVQRLGQIGTSRVAAAFGGGALLLALCIRDRRPEQKRPPALRDVRTVLGNRTLWRFGLVAMTFHFVWSGTTSCFTPLMAQRFAATSAQLGYLSAGGHLGIFIASAVLGIYVLPRLPARRVLFAGLCGMALCLLATAAAPGFGALLCIQALQGMVGYCVFLCALVHCMREVPEARRGVAMGLAQALYAAGMFLGPIVMGRLVECVGLKQSYAAVCVLCVVMAVLAARWAAAGRSEAGRRDLV